MIQRIAKKAQTPAYYIMACLFFFGNIKFIKMVLSYLGLTTGITIVATAVFAMLEVVLLYVFINKIFTQKKLKMLLLVIAINIIYAMPYLVTGKFYQLIQYCVFTVPFTAAAYLVIFDDDGLKKFFNCIYNISKIGVWFFVAYLIVLFVGKPGPFGIVEIKEMSYGDIAYASLPFLLVDLDKYFNATDKKAGIFSGIRVLVYLSVMIYTGTRSAMLCLIAAFLIQLFRNMKNIPKMGVKKCSCSFLALAACTCFCLTVIPDGARLNVVRSDIIYELGGDDAGEIFDKLPDKDPVKEPNTDEQFDKSKLDFEGKPLSCVYNIAAGKYMDISTAFEYYVVHTDAPISETESVLRWDISKDRAKYIVVNPAFYDEAIYYSLPMNSRVYLFSTAINEFKTSPIIGHGPLHYQLKYRGTFPHNLVFELMADFGSVGLVIVFIIVAYIYLYALVKAFKTKDRELGMLLAMLTMYIPMYLAYTSFYSNGFFIFTICVLIFYVIKSKNAKKQKA